MTCPTSLLNLEKSVCVCVWGGVGGLGGGGSELLTWQFFHRSLHAYTPYSEWCSKARVQTRDLIYEYVDNTFNCFF